LLAPERLPDPDGATSGRERAGGLLRWIFGSETLPRATGTTAASAVPQGFVRWLLAGERLPDRAEDQRQEGV
jgi:hypothetical protein